MAVGDIYKSPQVQVQLYFNDYDTGEFKGLYVWRERTIEEIGPSHDIIAMDPRHQRLVPDLLSHRSR